MREKILVVQALNDRNLSTVILSSINILYAIMLLILNESQQNVDTKILSPLCFFTFYAKGRGFMYFYCSFLGGLLPQY